MRLTNAMLYLATGGLNRAPVKTLALSSLIELRIPYYASSSHFILSNDTSAPLVFCAQFSWRHQAPTGRQPCQPWNNGHEIKIHYKLTPHGPGSSGHRPFQTAPSKRLTCRRTYCTHGRKWDGGKSSHPSDHYRHGSRFVWWSSVHSWPVSSVRFLQAQ